MFILTVICEKLFMPSLKVNCLFTKTAKQLYEFAVFGGDLDARATSSDLRYSRSMRSASNGTRGRSRRRALMSAQPAQQAGAGGAAFRRRQRAESLTAAGVELGRARCPNTGCIMQRSLSPPTCPTSSRGARRTNSTPMCRPT